MDYVCQRTQLGEETTDLQPNLSPSREPFPVSPNQTDEFVTLIDGGDIVLGPRQFVRVTDPVDKQGLYIGF